MHTGGCTPEDAHRRMLTRGCSPEDAHQRMLPLGIHLIEPQQKKLTGFPNQLFPINTI